MNLSQESLGTEVGCSACIFAPRFSRPKLLPRQGTEDVHAGREQLGVGMVRLVSLSSTNINIIIDIIIDIIIIDIIIINIIIIIFVVFYRPP